MKTLIATALLSSLSLSAAADNNCSLQFKDDLVIAPNSVHLERAQKQLWLINADGQLWIDSRKISTDQATTAALQQYQSGLRQQSKETLLLVGDALQLASDAVGKVVAGFGVDNSQLQSSVDQALNGLKTKIDHLVISNGDEIHINGSKMNRDDGQLTAEFEQAMQQSMAQLTGAVMMTMGQAMMQGEGNFEQRMEKFGKKMETFGAEIETEMEARSDGLERRGQAICHNLQQLDGLERKIQAAVPAMVPYDLIDITKEGLKNPLKTAAGQTE
ncbi:MAG: YggN family protein [Gammaproteobacteria bacterium]|nr:YggN family protein [Gammaproteobacteria bacterium]